MSDRDYNRNRGIRRLPEHMVPDDVEEVIFYPPEEEEYPPRRGGRGDDDRRRYRGDDPDSYRYDTYIPDDNPQSRIHTPRREPRSRYERYDRREPFLQRRWVKSFVATAGILMVGAYGNAQIYEKMSGVSAYPNEFKDVAEL